MAENGNGSGPKAMAGVLAIVAVVGGMYGVLQPVLDRLDSLADHVADLEAQVRNHTSDGHPARVLGKMEDLEKRLDERVEAEVLVNDAEHTHIFWRLEHLEDLEGCGTLRSLLPQEGSP